VYLTKGEKMNKLKCPKTNKKPVLKRCMELCGKPCNILKGDSNGIQRKYISNIE